ncbi:4'-phosphopantetheinyl transferase superfamily protein [Qipengyuania aquimaris]|uniref:Enterobactin synthase component D n=2 Tax=Qipengyuania aquimaris TaxID=255984 RepID=A0A9Q3XCJ4_9SPHN|nr:4'-phosphopantetheinyl transferase superfamily protein [Qipengyuania aquimaris]
MIGSTAQLGGLARAARSLLGPGVSVGFGLPAEGDAAELFPAELACTTAMVFRRRNEFAAGRAAVRMAAMADGTKPFAVPMGVDRAPVWPAGIVGSIAHTSDVCLAAISRSKRYAAIGIDIEHCAALPPDIAVEVVHGGDGLELESGPAPLPKHYGVAVFSAKEAVYKCQFPLTETILDFDALSIGFMPQSHRFVARFEERVGSFRAGDKLDGGYAFVGDHVLTVASIPRERWEKMTSCEVQAAHG